MPGGRIAFPEVGRASWAGQECTSLQYAGPEPDRVGGGDCDQGQPGEQEHARAEQQPLDDVATSGLEVGHVIIHRAGLQGRHGWTLG